MSDEDRLRYLCYRCYKCGRLLTRLEILKKWREAEKYVGEAGEAIRASLCPCGSRHISPTNPTLREELFLPRVWKLWWKEVLFK